VPHLTAQVAAVWLAFEPIDMRAGMDTALARAVKMFGAAQPRHAYLFAKRLKVLIHNGFCIWPASNRTPDRFAEIFNRRPYVGFGLIGGAGHGRVSGKISSAFLCSRY
jgi:hypothetical protein